MRSRQTFRVLSSVTLAFALAFLAASATGASAKASASSYPTVGWVSYADPAGDSQTAPDITGVAINGDQAAGALWLAIKVPGVIPNTPQGLQRSVTVYLDTDRNAATGSANGCEYALVVVRADYYWEAHSGLARWDGSQWQMVPSSNPASAIGEGIGQITMPSGILWWLNTADIGGAQSFAFYLEATVANGPNSSPRGQDFAPDAGRWVYDLSAPVPPPPAANSASFTDPSGDATGGAPDITAVSVATDYSGPFPPLVRFTVTTSGLPNLSAVGIYVDTDRNSATGAEGGFEAMLFVLWNGHSQLARWDGAAWQTVANPGWSTVSGLPGGGVARFGIEKDVLGATTGFSFQAITVLTDSGGNLLGGDVAPNTGSWAFDLALTPVIGAPVTTPPRPVAGKRFTVAFPVTRSDTGTPLPTGRMTSDPSVAGKVIPHAESFKAGKAKLSFLVPKAAKGKQLKVKVTITAGAKSATKVATFHVS
jgi:hypothetical protein